MVPKTQGGAGLLNLSNRLYAIKIKSLQFLITGKWNKEFDSIIYWAGTKNLILSGRLKNGPKCELCNNHYNKTINMMVTHRLKLSNIGVMKVKEIETILYPSPQKDVPYIAIYYGTNTKLVSLNFKIAVNILKTAVIRDDPNRACSLCHSRNETIYHIFLECEKLRLLRTYLIRYIQLACGKVKTLNWNLLINMKDLDNKIEYDIISVYKKVIWSEITKVCFDNKQFSVLGLCNTFLTEVFFYIRYIYDNG